MKYISIDNGLGGAICVMKNRKIIELIIMPVLRTTDTKGEYDINTIVQFLSKYKENSIMIIEKCHAMPLLGSVQAFSFGKSYGLMIGLAAALKIPYHIIHAKTWQKEMFRDINSDNTKQASVFVAKQLFPEQSFLATERSKKPHDGMTDSCLLGLYAERHNL